MSLSKIRHWDKIGLSLGAVLFYFATTTSGAYFLHFDTATQDFMALAWANGCWEYVTEKLLPVLLLTPLFRLFGPSPYWESLLLLAASVASLLIAYALACELTGSRWAGALAAALLSALPAHQYFSRVHLGYVLPFMLGGWLAILRNRWGWAGLCFSLAVLSHFGAFVPAVISVILAVVAGYRQLNARRLTAFGVSALAPVLAIETVFFLYFGELLLWTRGTLAVGLRWAGGGGSQIQNWFWLPRTILESNGFVLSAVLAVCPAALWLRRSNRLQAAMVASSLLSALAFAVIAFTKSGYVSRALAPFYPFWVIGATVVWHQLHLRVRPDLRRLAAAAAALAILLALINTGIFIRTFTQTPYSQLAPLIDRAAQERRPIRSVGNPWVVLFLASFRGSEILTNSTDWITAGDPGQAVLVFAGQSPSGLESRDYEINLLNANSDADGAFPGLTAEAGIPRRYEVWWPVQPSRPIGADPSIEAAQVELYYSGRGCFSPRPYRNGALYYYQLVLNKLAGWLGLDP